MKRMTLSLCLSFVLSNSVYAIDFPEVPLAAYDCETCATLSHEPLSTHWLLTNQFIQHEETPHQQRHSSYIVTATGEQLKKGLSLHAVGKNPIIRLQAENPLDIDLLFLRQNKTLIPIKEAAVLINEGTELENTPFKNEQIMFQLARLPQEKFELILAKNASFSGPITLRVDDLHSSIYLDIHTDKAFYKYGEQMTVTLHSLKYVEQLTDYVKVYLHSPQGIQYPIFLTLIDNNTYQGQLVLTDSTNPQGGNWYIEAEEEGFLAGVNFLRQTHTAFSYSIPSASVRSINNVPEKPLNFKARIQSAIASRFALQAVLLATDESGKKVPIARAQSAAWLTPGSNEIEFHFPSSISASYHPPFALTAIQLLDYGQIKSVFEYNKAIVIND